MIKSIVCSQGDNKSQAFSDATISIITSNEFAPQVTMLRSHQKGLSLIRKVQKEALVAALIISRKHCLLQLLLPISNNLLGVFQI